MCGRSFFSFNVGQLTTSDFFLFIDVNAHELHIIQLLKTVLVLPTSAILTAVVSISNYRTP